MDGSGASPGLGAGDDMDVASTDSEMPPMNFASPPRKRRPRELTELESGNMFNFRKAQVGLSQSSVAVKQRRIMNAQVDSGHIFTDSPTISMVAPFEWGVAIKETLGQLNLENPSPFLMPEPIAGYFEFAGGGAAEVAAEGLRSSEVCSINIASQSDWDKQSKKALLQNSSESCKFGDIMNCVAEHCRSELLMQKPEIVELGDRDLRSVLGLVEVSGSESSSSSSTSASTKTVLAVSPASSDSCVQTETPPQLVSKEIVREMIEKLFNKKQILKKPLHAGVSPSKSFSSVLSRLADVIFNGHDCKAKIKFKR
ncbi:unnamed protein product, partial [Durusdinium trenchii]